jgi:uncharacterized protein YndB with AHSA1/START domain
MATLRRRWQVDPGPRTTWQAFTTPDGLAAWRCVHARIDAREGGRVVLRPHGADADESALIHTWRPTSRLELTFDRTSAGPWKGSIIGVHIGRDGDQTTVHVTHESALLDVPGAEEALGAWWDEALVRLGKHLDG